jgi:PadR family transcriptional regulator, regulatory protein PadR
MVDGDGGEGDDDRKALQGVTRFRRVKRCQRHAAQHHIGHHGGGKSRPIERTDQPCRQIKQIQGAVGIRNPGFGMVQAVLLPTQFYVEHFHPWTKPHIHEAKQRQGHSVLLFPPLLSSHMRSVIPMGTQEVAKMGEKADVWQGTLALMVLKTIEAMGPLHGYGIARRIEQTSAKQLSLNYGTLYPALLKLEQEGAIVSEWGVSDNNRKAKFYRLTRSGRKRLERETRDWEQTIAILARFLSPAEEA